MINLPLMSNNITSDDVEKLIEFLQTSDIFTQSKNVEKFEEEWSKWLGVKYSVFVNSGSSANFITMGILKELYGTCDIIVPAITWVSDYASILLFGHNPIVVDVNLHNISMNEQCVLNAITKKTKAVFITHILGFNALTENLLKELKQKNIMLIEDVCESHGATCSNKKLGTFSDVSNFSFYYAHHMSTIEGGMICSDDKRIYEYARMFRSHGMVRESKSDVLKEEYKNNHKDIYEEFIFALPGFNMRSTELNAVIGLNQLKRLDENNDKRRRNFKLFLDNLNSSMFYTDFDLEGSVNYAFVLLMRKADNALMENVMKVLKEENVEFRRGTSGGGNMTRQPFFKKRFPHVVPESFVNADFIHKFGMYIGNYPLLEEEKILLLCHALNKA